MKIRIKLKPNDIHNIRVGTQIKHIHTPILTVVKICMMKEGDQRRATLYKNMSERKIVEYNGGSWDWLDEELLKKVIKF